MTGTVDWKTISDIAEEYLYNTTADDDDDAHNPQRGMVPIETERRETNETILEATTTTVIAGGRNTQSPVRQQQQQKKEGSEEVRIDEIFQQQKQQWMWLSSQERNRTNDPQDRQQQQQQWHWQCRWLWDQQQNLIPNDRPYQCSIPLSLYNYTESNDKDNDKNVRRVTPHPNEEIDPNVIRPGPNDVLFRSGKNHSSHPGTAVFYKMIQARYEEHAQSHQDEKAVISRSIVDEIEERGGRFLIWDYNTPKVRYVRKHQKKKRKDDSWLVIEDYVTRRGKVGSYFRLYRRRLLDAKKRKKVLSVEEVKEKRRYENVMKEFREELVALKKAEEAKKAELAALQKAAEFKKANATAKTGTAA